jgi:hypothetical protein
MYRLDPDRWMLGESGRAGKFLKGFVAVEISLHPKQIR